MKKTNNMLKMRLERLYSDERGVVFYYTAIIAFFIMAVFTMLYDVSRVSEQKIQMQAAADSAALEMAVWQARGMNLVQNLNNEIYQTDDVLAIVYGIAGGMVILGDVLLDTFLFAEIGEGIIRTACGIADTVRTIHKYIVETLLINIREVYADGTMLIGYIGANNVAYHNGPPDQVIPSIPTVSDGGLIGIILNFIIDGIDDILKQFVAVGIPTSPDAALKLPLNSDKSVDIPLNVSLDTKNIGYKALMLALFDFPPEGCMVSLEDISPGHPGWVDNIYRSKNPEQLKVPPMIWLVHKKNDISFISKYFLGGTDSDYNDVAIWAYAVGQAQGGNVTKRSSFSNPYRPKYYGVGADAFLVPMSSLPLSKSASKDNITITLSLQDYVDKFFIH